MPPLIKFLRKLSRCYIAYPLAFLCACSPSNPKIQKVIDAQAKYETCQSQHFAAATGDRACAQKLDEWSQAEKEAIDSGINQQTLMDAVAAHHRKQK